MDRVFERLHIDYARKIGLTGNGVRICVLDTGIFSHRDFDHRIVGFRDFLYGSSGANYDDNGHGTHVCGIVAGSGAASRGRYQGIAPKAELVVGKILDQNGKGDLELLLEAFDWILKEQKELNIKVVNVSIGITESHQWMNTVKKRELIQRYVRKLYDQHILVVSAAGNLGPLSHTISLLGESPLVICVGCHDLFAQDSKGKKSCESFSGRGPTLYAEKKPDVVAPGTDIISCSRDFAGYVRKTGTSMACPIVTGLAALLWEKNPHRTMDEWMRGIRNGATDLGEPWNKQGYGMIDAKKMLFTPENIDI